MEENQSTEVQTDTPVTKKSGNALVIGLLIVIALILVPRLFRAGSGVQTVTPTPPSESPPTLVDVTSGVISIEAGSYYYKPNMIRVKKGQKIKLTLNAVSMMHDFNIDELKIKIPVTKDGTSSTVEFTVDQVGELEFYCSVGEHRKLGQVGKLIVVD